MHDHAGQSLNALALAATVHCLTGCAIGEVLGMALGTALGWSNGATVVASILLAFVFGYGLTSVPLVRSGLPVGRVAPLAFASDTLSLTTMEIVDTLIVLIIPGALDAGLTDPLFWASLVAALAPRRSRRLPGQPPPDRARQGARRDPRLPLTIEVRPRLLSRSSTPCLLARNHEAGARGVARHVFGAHAQDRPAALAHVQA